MLKKKTPGDAEKFGKSGAWAGKYGPALRRGCFWSLYWMAQFFRVLLTASLGCLLGIESVTNIIPTIMVNLVSVYGIPTDATVMETMTFMSGSSVCVGSLCAIAIAILCVCFWKFSGKVVNALKRN